MVCADVNMNCYIPELLSKIFVFFVLFVVILFQ